MDNLRPNLQMVKGLAKFILNGGTSKSFDIDKIYIDAVGCPGMSKDCSVSYDELDDITLNQLIYRYKKYAWGECAIKYEEQLRDQREHAIDFMFKNLTQSISNGAY